MAAPSDPGPEPTDELTVEALVHERDALRQQVDRLAGRRRRGARTRGLIAGFLVLVYGLLFITSGVGIWLHRNTLNRDVWNERVVPLGEDPAVQQALATWATDQLMQTVDPKGLFQDALPPKAQILAVPMSAAVETFVRDKVDQFFASERFVKIWTVAATQAHDQAIKTLRDQRPAVTADSDKVTINLVPLLDAILNEILDAAPGLVGADVTIPTVSVTDVPAVAREKLADALGLDLSEDFGTITVYDGGKLRAAQDAVRLFDKVVVLTAVLTVLLFAAALWASARRRRTLLQLVGATAVACIVVRRVCFLLQDQVLELLRDDQNRAAVRVVLLGFVSPLTNTASLALWAAAIVGAVAAITGPYPWAVGLRQAAARMVGTATTAVTDKATDDQTSAWIVEHADALRIAGYVAGALVLWFVDLSWAVLILVAAAVAAWQVFLSRLAPVPDDEPPVAPPGADPAATSAAG